MTVLCEGCQQSFISLADAKRHQKRKEKCAGSELVVFEV